MTIDMVGLRAWRGDRAVLDGVDVHVGTGEVLAVVGPNGSGKTTLLRCLAGTLPCSFERYTVDGVPFDGVPTAATRLHALLDDGAWFPDLTVADHLALLLPAPPPADAHDQGIDEALEAVGLAGLGDRLPRTLSAGQSRRAALAAAVVRPWRVLLLDEPEQHLDEAGLDMLVGLLSGFRASGRSVVLSTHSTRLVARLGCTTSRLR